MSRYAWFIGLIPAVLLFGCPDDQPTDDDDSEVEEVWASLEFTLETDSTVAGAPVGYTAELVAESGIRKAVAVDIASDLEASLAFGEADLTATVAGVHALWAAATEGDDTFDAEASLTVEAGSLASIDLVLTSNEAPAGVPVGFSASGADGYGNPVEMGTYELLVDAELTVDGNEVSGTLVGLYELTAVIGSVAGDVSDTETLEILPGDPFEVDLTLSAASMTVGETVTWSVVILDGYGNEIPEGDATFAVTADSGDVSISGYDVTCEVAGGYVVRVDVEGGSTPWDTEALEVLAGEPVSIELTLSTTAPEVDDPVMATAVILDAYGNEADETWTLDVTAEPGSDQAHVTVTDHEFVFSGDGWFTATATVDLNGAFDTEGPFLVDSFGPSITVTNPERGAWRTSYADTVTGTIDEPWSGLASASVNGDAVTVTGGAFSHPITYDFGITVVETLATDLEGNEESDRRAVLAGDFVAEGSGVDDGMVARVNQGALDELEVIGEDMIDNTDVAGLIPDPVYYGWAEDCWDPCGGWFGGCEICITWYELSLHVNNPTLGDSDLEIDPRAGTIHADGTVYDINVPWSASGAVIGIGYSASGTISADSITIGMDITPSISGGQIQTSVSNVTVSSANFDFDFDSWIYDAAVWFGFDIDGTVQGYVEDAIQSAVQDEVPGLLEDMLQDLEIGADFDFEGVTYDFLAEPSSVSVDDDGITLGLATYLTAGTWNSPYTGLGSLYYGYSVPAYGATPGMEVSISADFLNQAMLAFWGGGLLDQDLGTTELGIDPSDLAFLGGNIVDPHLITEAMLPPVVLPGTNGHMLDLQAGDMMVSIYGDDPSDPANLLFILYIGFDAGLELTVNANGNLEATISDIEAWFDVVYPVMPNSLATDMEDLLDLLVPGLTPLITDAIGEIEIPEFDGFTLTSIAISTGGAEAGYVNAGGDLVVN